MTLLELLVKELPKRGGWPKSAHGVVQDASGNFWFFKNGTPYYNGKHWGAAKLSADFEWIDIDWDISPLLAEDNHHAIITREQYEDAIAEEHAAGWNGEGLPPVGMKVEWRSEKYGWSAGTVAAYDAKYPKTAIIRHSDGYTGCHRDEIRTKAERDRDLSIDNLAYFLDSFDFTRFSAYVVAKEILEAVESGEITGLKLSDKE